jgi:catechol 2,3-dioxygenase-like lactoylglutathione lyase family enzyme
MLQLSRIGQISMRAHDIARATNFYRDKLGMRFLFAVGDKMAFFDCDGVRLMLSLPEGPEFDHPGSILYFQVDDIVSAFKTLEERAVNILSPPHLVARMDTHDLWMGFFNDSEDNVLSLTSEVKK